MMRTIYSSELISKNRVKGTIDFPSDIEHIVGQLKYGENVNKKYLKDHIFMLRNFCAPYSQDIYDRIMSLFDAYETLFSMEKFKNEMKVKHYKKIKNTLQIIFSDIGFPKKAEQIWVNAWYWTSEKCVKQIYNCFMQPNSYCLSDVFVKNCYLMKLPGFGLKTVAKIIFTMEYENEILPDIKKNIIDNSRKEEEKENKFKLLIRQLETTKKLLEEKNLELKNSINTSSTSNNDEE